MHFPVFLDTCVLYPIVLTDTLLRVAEQSVFRPHWSGDVMEELQRNLELIPEVEAVHPDTFLLDQLDLYPEAVARALRRQSVESARPRLTPLQLMASYEKLALKDFASELRRRWPNLEGGRW